MNMELIKYLQPRPRYRWQPWIIVGLLLGLAVWTALWAYDESRELGRIERRIDKLRAEQQKTAIPLPTKQEEADAKKWAELKIERSFAWDTLFNAIEHASSNDIELLEFQPDKSSRTVIVSGEAKDQKALLAFLTALAVQPGFKRVHLTHQQGVVRDRLQTISFEIRAALRP
ncbi:PilN domain-containing protein [Undibacterium terreum]|uniref:Uncharacterized protein n=1 Tax=Undibacterium terreum TaxID=1224302 RepID=A0A916UU83_9BURK|nr:PilN domain-containing protein [Undibacterium terreum]GGC87262.1 hypothetical protein GCM10011396_38160 [Undibacterium terreum]